MITAFKSNAEVIENGDKYLYGNHVRMPLALEGGEGSWVFDKDGNKYLDFIGGIAVNGLGHNHPRIQECLADRAKSILHCSNYFYNEPAVQTAKMIVENSCFEKVLYANSGAEANEGQIKLARKYAKDHGHPERFVVITMKNSFHGRTLATCTATGQYGIHRYFEPLPDGFRYATFNDLDSVKALVDEYTCAILTEPVQGEGGVRPATKEFLQGLREICDERDILLMFDEVQVGSGRTGKLFAHQHYGVEPDTCSMAKALGSGVPIAALCARGEATKTLVPGTHGSTFAGGPLACALAMTTLDVMLNDGLLESCAEVGEYLRQQAHDVIEKNHPGLVKEIRGLGLINGIELNKESGQPVVDLCFQDSNVLINNTDGNVLRLVPPLIATKEEVDIVINAIDDAMTKLGW